ncbi:MAG: hypothetical protein VX278_15765, partial [Myxococcota bacterium]|nr:hypothetical protein [Myxococcota bacterium]
MFVVRLWIPIRSAQYLFLGALLCVFFRIMLAIFVWHLGWMPSVLTDSKILIPIMNILTAALFFLGCLSLTSSVKDV